MKTINENPKGLHQRYVIRKVIGTKREGFFDTETLITEPVEKNSEYFVMRVDFGGKDEKHITACRKAVCFYAELIKDHLPELSKDLIEKYSDCNETIPLCSPVEVSDKERIGTLHKNGEDWIVKWDELSRGLSNLSLPVHPDQVWVIPLKDGNTVKFTTSYHCGAINRFDCVKITKIYPYGIHSKWYTTIN